MIIEAVSSLAAFIYPPCEIWVAHDRESVQEIIAHEIAHCKGWIHEDQNHPKSGPPPGYKSPPIPARYRGRYQGKLIIHWVSTEVAVAMWSSYGYSRGGL